MLKKIDSNPKAFAIVYGAVGSIAASLLWTVVPHIADWLAASSWGILVNFINRRYEAAATLEPVNYSFFVLTVIFLVIAFLWLEISSRLTKKLSTSRVEEPEMVEEVREPSKFYKVFAYVLIRLAVPLYLLYVLFQISGQVITLNAITDFKQHMRILGPYLTQEETTQLYSKWSQMRSTEDYDAIYKRLLEVANANSVRLPRNHVY